MRRETVEQEKVGKREEWRRVAEGGRIDKEMKPVRGEKLKKETVRVKPKRRETLTRLLVPAQVPS
jgi:hypothetical protein